MIFCISWVFLESIGKINRYTLSCATADEFYFFNEQMNFNASLNLLANIGELCAKTSSELKLKYPNVDWQRVKDFRNRIVHDYAELDIYIIFKIIQTELPVLKEEVQKIISKEVALFTFDIEEINVARDSAFYSHIDFSEIKIKKV
jgi:uncharacterized protein with HEPN domain